MTGELFFATGNSYKFTEFQRLFAMHGVALRQARLDIQEIQSVGFDPLIRDKIRKAYDQVSRPVLVDASGMSISALKGLPGGLNAQFWELLQETICEIGVRFADPRATIVTSLAVCDGRQVYAIEHGDTGRLAATASATGSFHIERVFIPDGWTTPISEWCESDRDQHSYRRKAVEKLIAVLKKTQFGKSLGLR